MGKNFCHTWEKILDARQSLLLEQRETISNPWCFIDCSINESPIIPHPRIPVFIFNLLPSYFKYIFLQLVLLSPRF